MENNLQRVNVPRNTNPIAFRWKLLQIQYVVLETHLIPHVQPRVIPNISVVIQEKAC